MKIKMLTVLFVSSLWICLGCSSDDDRSEAVTLDGVYNLKNISGGFLGIDIEYERGSVTWEFEPEGQNLLVINSIIDTSPQSIYVPLESGIYAYTLIESNGDNFIAIEGFQNGEYGQYILNDSGELILYQGQGPEVSTTDLFTLGFD